MSETKKNLRFFMRPEAKEEQIVTAPGPASIVDENGKPIMLEIRVLHNSRIRSINDAYRTRTMATDKKGNPLLYGGEVVFKVEKDNNRATRHIIAESLVYPDLTDPELQKFFNCYDKVDMVDKVFPSAEEYNHISRVVMAALGLAPAAGLNNEESDDKLVNEAKN